MSRIWLIWFRYRGHWRVQCSSDQYLGIFAELLYSLLRNLRYKWRRILWAKRMACNFFILCSYSAKYSDDRIQARISCINESNLKIIYYKTRSFISFAVLGVFHAEWITVVTEIQIRCKNISKIIFYLQL